MKLYTEEQVIQLLDHHTVLTPNWIKHYLNKLTPIELPSDEDIEKQSIGNATFAPSFISGAKWVREQITKTK